MTNDEILQNKVEAEEFDDSLDSISYKKVFEALKRESSAHIPINFADRLVTLIEARESKKSSRLELLLFICGAILSVILFAVAIVLTKFELNLGFLKSINNFKGLIAFTIIFTGILLLLERRLLRKEESY